MLDDSRAKRADADTAAFVRSCLESIEREARKVRRDLERTRPLEVLTQRTLMTEGRALARMHGELALVLADVERGYIAGSEAIQHVHQTLRREMPTDSRGLRHVFVRHAFVTAPSGAVAS